MNVVLFFMLADVAIICVDMLDIRLALERKLVLTDEIPLVFSGFTSLKRWSSFALPAQMSMSPGKCMRK